MWKVLKHYGIPEKIINFIKDMYDEFNCTIEYRTLHSFENRLHMTVGSFPRWMVSLGESSVDRNWSWHWCNFLFTRIEKHISDSYQIETNLIVVTVFLLIIWTNCGLPSLVHKIKWKTLLYDHIRSSLTRIRNAFLCCI